MEIRFGFDERTGKIECGIPGKELCLTDYEENFFHTLLEVLSKSVDISRIRLEKKTVIHTHLFAMELESLLTLYVSNLPIEQSGCLYPLRK